MPGVCENHSQVISGMDRLANSVHELSQQVAVSNAQNADIVRRLEQADKDRKALWERTDAHDREITKQAADDEWMKGNRKLVWSFISGAAISVITSALGFGCGMLLMYMKTKGGG